MACGGAAGRRNTSRPPGDADRREAAAVEMVTWSLVTSLRFHPDSERGRRGALAAHAEGYTARHTRPTTQVHLVVNTTENHFDLLRELIHECLPGARK